MIKYIQFSSGSIQTFDTRTIMLNVSIDCITQLTSYTNATYTYVKILNNTIEWNRPRQLEDEILISIMEDIEKIMKSRKSKIVYIKDIVNMLKEIYWNA